MRTILLLIALSAAPVQAQTKYTGSDGRLRVSLAQQPFSPNGTSRGPNTMASGGIRDTLARLNAVVRLAEAALTPIRQYAAGSFMVLLRLLERIEVVVKTAASEDDRGVLRRHAEMIVRNARESLPEEEDRKAVERAYDAINEALSTPRNPLSSS